MAECDKLELYPRKDMRRQGLCAQVASYLRRYLLPVYFLIFEPFPPVHEDRSSGTKIRNTSTSPRYQKASHDCVSTRNKRF